MFLLLCFYHYYASIIIILLLLLLLCFFYYAYIILLLLILLIFGGYLSLRLGFLSRFFVFYVFFCFCLQSSPLFYYHIFTFWFPHMFLCVLYASLLLSDDFPHFFIFIYPSGLPLMFLRILCVLVLLSLNHSPTEALSERKYKKEQL